MKVGFHAPLPPERTGVADYAAALLTALRRCGDVETERPRADVCLYHLGNNSLHRQIYWRALEHPGVVVLHDAILQHFLLGELDQDAYVNEFVYNYGEWHRGLAHELWRTRASSGLGNHHYQFPMLKRIAQRSRAIIVHSSRAAEIVRDHWTATPVIEIPHLFQCPAVVSEADAMRFRQQWNIPSCAFVFGVFGFLRESKRVMTVLDVFERVRRARPDAVLMLAGPFASMDLARLVGAMTPRPGVVRIPYLSEPEFWRAAMATDVCINLRYPSAGETSGIAIRMMGIGKTVMLSSGPEYARFPDGCCIRIDHGLAETSSLWHHMILVRSFPDVARAIGRHAAFHIARHHGLEQVAEQYWKTLCEFRS
jgi:glycosyltransferase involved in cell wall biosynthesis